jgi:hypothetical protein
MKKSILLLLAVILVLSLCSCDPPTHRKLQFDDGESYCFSGSCDINDTYIGIFNATLNPNTNWSYISISGRQYSITNCDCDNIKK